VREIFPIRSISFVNQCHIGRDQGYLNLNSSIVVNLLYDATILKMFPKPLKPIVARVISNFPSHIRQEEEFIRPIVQERFARMEEFGDDWDDKPNDMLMWLISEAKGVERSVEGLVRRFLQVNFAATVSTTPSFTTALYYLLSNPEYIEPLRHEVETAVSEEGWTKAGMDKMIKIDSFFRECLRISGTGIGPLGYPGRTSVSDALITFSSVDESSRITSVHIFQWSHRSCGYSNRCPVCSDPDG
jgi:hypothetical protein